MTSTAVQNSVEIRPLGASGQIGEILTTFRFFFIYTPFLSNAPTGQTLTTFSRLMAQMTWSHARVCLFWLWLILRHIYGINCPKTPIFGA